jgi:DNA replication protein DnaC
LRTWTTRAARYAHFCRHYDIEPSRNNAGVSHENGSVEAAHGHLKVGLGEALEQSGNLLIFGGSGTGKTHLAAAIGTALVDNGRRVLFSRTTDLVQKAASSAP